MVKDIARRERFLATFTAKPFSDQSGSGFHTHYSQWKDGKNVFAKGGKLNDLGYAFLVGLHAKPHGGDVNRRNGHPRKPTAAASRGCFARSTPLGGTITAPWPCASLKAATAACASKSATVRQIATPDCLLACELAAGLDGLEVGLKPIGPATLGDACKLADADALQTTIDRAIGLTEGSDFLKRIMGSDALTILLQQFRRECDFVAAQVTAVETSRYVGSF